MQFPEEMFKKKKEERYKEGILEVLCSDEFPLLRQPS